MQCNILIFVTIQQGYEDIFPGRNVLNSGCPSPYLTPQKVVEYLDNIFLRLQVYIKVIEMRSYSSRVNQCPSTKANPPQIQTCSNERRTTAAGHSDKSPVTVD